MQKLRLLGALAAVGLLLMLTSSVHAPPPPPQENEPRYNLGCGYREPFRDIPQGGTGETILYFYSAYGNVTCYVAVNVEAAPQGWRVEYQPEMVIVEPQWFSENKFEVEPGQECLLLKYVEDNENKQGYVRAWTVKVSVKVPENEALGTYTVRVGYVGDWKMGGMSAVTRAGNAEWRIKVVESTPIVGPGTSPIWFIAGLITILAVPTTVFRSKWVPAMVSLGSKIRSRAHMPTLPKLPGKPIKLMDQLKVHKGGRPAVVASVPGGEPESPPLPPGHRPTPRRLSLTDIGIAIAFILMLFGFLLVVGLL